MWRTAANGFGGYCAILSLTGKKDHRPILYTDLIVTKKLFPHLEEIDTAYRERLEIIEKAMLQQEGVTEALKAADQVAWVRSMNSSHNRAEEIVLARWFTYVTNILTQKPLCPDELEHKGFCF